jgi:hypothetical protein
MYLYNLFPPSVGSQNIAPEIIMHANSDFRTMFVSIAFPFPSSVAYETD